MGRENNWNTLGEDNMAGNSGESDSHTKARSDFGGKVWKEKDRGGPVSSARD